RQQSASRVSRRTVLAGGAAAAAAAGVLIIRPPLELWPSLAELSADHRTAIGEQQHLTLAEPVSLDLNTRTSIAVRSTEQANGIELIWGEAAVTVGNTAKKPFVVRAANGEMSTSLATFNVRRIDANVRLTCISGAVAVSCNGRTLLVNGGQ